MIYLCKPGGKIYGLLNGIDESTCSLKQNLNDLWELSFDVYADIDNEKTSFYDSISTNMELLLQTEDNSYYFVIDQEPSVSSDGNVEKKSVTAHSIEAILQNKTLRLFQINCGIKTSQEYLAYKDGEYYNVDPITGLPLKYISLVNYEDPQLSLLHLAIEKAGAVGWTVEENLDEDYCKKKFSFNIDNSNIYAFLTKDLSSTAKIIITFDRYNKKIGFKIPKDIGKDTGIFIGYRNLANSVDIKSTNDDGIITKYYPTGADNLGIEYVNFGSDYIINLDYFMNKKNDYGKYKYVSDDLYTHYNNWLNFRNNEKYNGYDNRFEAYIEITKLYNQTILDINELTYRVPNDGVNIDYKTYKIDELKISLTAYQNALVAIKESYFQDVKEEHTKYADGYTFRIDDETYHTLAKQDGSEEWIDITVKDNVGSIKNTLYWIDFNSYKNVIIPKVIEACKIWCSTDEDGDLCDAEGHKLIVITSDILNVLEFGNPDYGTNEDLLKEIDAWQYDWSLFGLRELQSKLKAWRECANTIFSESYYLLDEQGQPVYDEHGNHVYADSYNDLTPEQKTQYQVKYTSTSFLTNLNMYLDYMSTEDRENGITGKTGKGIIIQCQEAINERQGQIDEIKVNQNIYSNELEELRSSTRLYSYEYDYTDQDNPHIVYYSDFLDIDEIPIVESLIHETDYNNSNILITNLNDIVSTVDVQKELYDDAMKDLEIKSQPQYTFSCNIDNLFALEEFKNFGDYVILGNFIHLTQDLSDEEFIKLRIISINRNPILNTEELELTFSNMINNSEGQSDLIYLFEEMSGGNSSGSGGGGSSSGGTYGTNDAEIQISNNVLNALLSSDSLISGVTDGILNNLKANNANITSLFANSGLFNELAVGNTKVSADCLTTGEIKSENYDGKDLNPLENENGSIIRLNDGTFNFGGGALKLDEDNVLSMNSGYIKSANYSPSGVLRGSMIDLNYGNFSFAGGRISFDGDILRINGYASKEELEDGTIEIAVSAEGLTGQVLHSTNYSSTSGNMLSLEENGGFSFGGGKLKYDTVNGLYVNGEIHATSGIFNGEIRATSGNIGGFITDDKYIYSDNIGLLSTSNTNSPSIWCGASKENRFSAPFRIYNDGSIFLGDGNIDFNTGYTYESRGEEGLYYKKNISLNKSNIKLYLNKISNNGSTYVSVPIDDIMDEFLHEELVDCVISQQYYSANYYCDDVFIGIDDNGDSYMGCMGYNESSYGLSRIKINPRMIEASLIGTIINELDYSNKCIFDSSGIRDTENAINSSFIYGVNLKSLGAYTQRALKSARTLYIGNDGTISASSSSRRFKQDIEYLPICDAHGLYNLKPAQYRYNAENGGGDNSKLYYGFIAEDVAEHYPIAASFNSDNTEVDTWEVRDMIPGMLELIQEQHSEIENMKKEINDLKEKYNG